MSLTQAPRALRSAVRTALGGGVGGRLLQQGKLTAADGSQSDRFGSAVAMTGSTAVVGTPGKNGGAGVAYVFVRSGKIWMEQAELVASDSAPGDSFGWSVAISGSANPTVVVGAYGKNSQAGAAYVFVRSGQLWAEQAKLVASDAAVQDRFGSAVALSGSAALIGAPGKSGDAGAVYSFARSGSTWTQGSVLTASDTGGGDHFGLSVSISGSAAVVGAYGQRSTAGAAYVFTKSGSYWSQQAKLLPPPNDTNPGDLFGRSVAISGQTVAIGAPGKTAGAGAVYLFTGSGNQWAQASKLIASDGGPNDYFGFPVATSGSTLVAGAPGKDSTAGSAYVFARYGALWTQQTRLPASDLSPGDELGVAVAMAGASVFVGTDGQASGTGAVYRYLLPVQSAELQARDHAPNDQFALHVAVSGSIAIVGSARKDAQGAAYVFVRSGSTWSQEAKLVGSDTVQGDGFGSSVAISGSTAVIGAQYKNVGQAYFAGVVYVFVRSGGTWSQEAELIASDPATSDAFGSAVAVSGSTAVVGAPDKLPSPAAYVFVRSGSTWSQQAKLTAADNPERTRFGWSVAVSGSTAIVGDLISLPGGAAYAFARQGTTWTQQAKLTASDQATGDQFGASVGISGTTAVVGAPAKDNFGRAYVFVASGGVWTQAANLTAVDPASCSGFGGAVAISNSTVLVGAGADNGMVWVFTPVGQTWVSETKLTASDSVFGDGFGYFVAISGSTALIGAPGKNSSTGAAYVFKLP